MRAVAQLSTATLIFALFARARAEPNGQVVLAQDDHTSTLDAPDDFASPHGKPKWRSRKHAGQPKRVHYPPATVNETFDPDAFFSVPEGYLGNAQPGDERLAAEEAYPPPINAPGLPRVWTRDNKKNFDAPANWGNLSPYNALPHDTHGLDTSPAIPDGCKLQQVHILHRHGARFPESDDPPPTFARRLHKAVKKKHGFTARGELEFLNRWRYPLGEETLVTLGRAQLFNLGASMRIKYGALLEEYSDRLPVFRTTSQHRMYHSALNFAAGFFGIPYEDQYHQLVIVEALHYNNTLAPHKICPGGRRAGKQAIRTWMHTFLKEARERLELQIDGFDLTIKDVFGMLQMCAYETVALGSSPFCELFTAEEHRGLGYAADLRFHAGSFGSRVGPANGIGWTRELLARLEAPEKTKSGLADTWKALGRHGWKWGLNGTLVGNEVTFPLNGAIYVDTTHDTVIAGVLAAMNITSLRSFPRMPRRRIPRTEKRFSSAKTVPFGANLVGQVIVCHTDSREGSPLPRPDMGTTKRKPEAFMRWVLNDAVLPLHTVHGCGKSTLGLCPLPAFTAALHKRLEEVDFISLCELQPDEDGGDDGDDPDDPEEEEPPEEEPPKQPEEGGEPSGAAMDDEDDEEDLTDSWWW